MRETFEQRQARYRQQEQAARSSSEQAEPVRERLARWQNQWEAKHPATKDAPSSQTDQYVEVKSPLYGPIRLNLTELRRRLVKDPEYLCKAAALCVLDYDSTKRLLA